MKNKKLVILAAGLLIISAASIKPAMAYFTDSKEVKGRVQISVGDSELEPRETVDEMTKFITIKNTGEYTAFIRVRAIYGSNITATLTDEAKKNGWRAAKDGEDADYYYYDPQVAPDETTKELQIKFDCTEILSDTFNVVIIEEAAKVTHKEDGTAYADWKDKAISEDEFETKIKDKANNQGGDN